MNANTTRPCIVGQVIENTVFPGRARLARLVALCCVLVAGLLAATRAPSAPAPAESFSLNQRDVPIAEVMDMLSRRARVNILLSKEVTGTVSFNRYDVGLMKRSAPSLPRPDMPSSCAATATSS